MIRLSWLMLAVAPMLPAVAQAQLFSAPVLDPAFCDQPTARQTVVYVDDMMMVDGQTQWAQRLADKLRATLAPGEKLTVVQLSPASGQSHELWSACWADYTAPSRARLAAQTFIFQRNPLDRLADQQKLFLRGLNDALAQIYGAAHRSAEAVHTSPQHAAGKQIIRALANDEGRFTGSTTTIRAIIYSDLAENSDLGSVFSPAPAPADFGRVLGSYLRHAVFYGFGLGADVEGDPGFPEAARAFWTAALRSMAASVGGLNSDLNVPNIVPVHGTSLPVTLDFNGQLLDGRLSLLTDNEGNLVDSWLGISRLGSSPLVGTFTCADGGNCTLNADTLGSLTTTSSSEALRMSGKLLSGLHGRLGLAGSSTLFTIATTRPE